MNNVNKTLYIPLYGKALVSRRGILLADKKAEAIWDAEGFALKGKSRSKWLAFYMAMRARVFDEWVKQKLAECPEAVVLHIGCGMDSRVERVQADCCWYDIDFADVIEERKRYYTETDRYRMFAADMRDTEWLAAFPDIQTAVVVMEGVSMYVKPEELKAVLQNLAGRFADLHILMDCYTTLAAKASKYKNPINDVGVTQVYGLDDPEALANESGILFVKEHKMTPLRYIEELKGSERVLFRYLYGGTVAKKMYRLYELASKKEQGR